MPSKRNFHFFPLFGGIWWRKDEFTQLIDFHQYLLERNNLTDNDWYSTGQRGGYLLLIINWIVAITSNEPDLNSPSFFVRSFDQTNYRHRLHCMFRVVPLDLIHFGVWSFSVVHSRVHKTLIAFAFPSSQWRSSTFIFNTSYLYECQLTRLSHDKFRNIYRVRESSHTASKTEEKRSGKRAIESSHTPCHFSGDSQCNINGTNGKQSIEISGSTNEVRMSHTHWERVAS